MADDFSLDPLATENDILSDRVRRAQALRLRATPAAGDVYGRQERVYNDVMGQSIARQSEQSRRDLSSQYEEQLSAALQDAPPEIRSLVLSPATRKEGLELLKKHHQMRQSDQNMEKFMPGGKFGGGKALGGGTVGQGDSIPGMSLETAMALQSSDDENLRKQGQAVIKLHEGRDPRNTMRMGASGNYSAIPGAIEGYNATQGAQFAAQHPQGYQIPDGQGGMITLPAPGAAQPPGGAGTPVPGPVGPPASGPSSPATGRSALPLSTGAAPIGDTQNMTAVPGGMQVDPRIQAQRDQQKIQVLMQELQQEMPKAQAGDPEAQRNVQALQREIAIAQKQTGGAPGQNVVAGPGGMPPPAPQQRALPNAVPLPQVQGVPQPNAGVGRTNPVQQDIYKHGATTNQDEQRKMEEASTMGGKILRSLYAIEQRNKAPTWSGGAAGAITTFDNWLGSVTKGTSERGINTEAMDAEIQNTLGPLLKEYGYNPSNRDLMVAVKRMPRINQDPRARQEIINDLRKGVEAEIEVKGVARWMMDQAQQSGVTMSPKQAEEQAWKMYNQKRDAEEAAKRQANPTQPGGASALPGARAAVDKNLEDKDTFASDLWRNAKSLPGAIFSKGGLDAMKDQYGNIKAGAQGLGDIVGLNLGDREAAMADVARQEARAKVDPDYNQASIFHSIANPTSLVGGGVGKAARAAPTVAKLAIPTVAQMAKGGFVQGALQPQESFNEQLVQGLKTGAVAGGVGIAAKGIPTTQLGREINVGGEGDKLLKQFPSFKPTSAQANPLAGESAVARGLGTTEAASLKQTQAITKDLMTHAGMKGEQLTPEVIKAWEGDMGKSFNAVFKNSKNIDTPPELKKQVVDAINNFAVANRLPESSKLVQLRQFLSDKNIRSIKPEGLHEVWKEIGQVAVDKQTAGAMRGALEDLISKGISPAKLAEFKQLNSQWGVGKDIQRIWRGGGSEGSTAASGYLNPAKIVTEAGTGPSHSVTDDAARLIQKFGVRNFRTEAVEGTDKYGIVRDVVKPVAGGVLNALDKTAIRARPTTKRVIEALRAGTQAPRYLEATTGNAPPASPEEYQ